MAAGSRDTILLGGSDVVRSVACAKARVLKGIHEWFWWGRVVDLTWWFVRFSVGRVAPSRELFLVWCVPEF